MGDVEIVIKVPEGFGEKRIKELVEKADEIVFWEKVRKYVKTTDFGSLGKGSADEFEELKGEVYEQ